MTTLPQRHVADAHALAAWLLAAALEWLHHGGGQVGRTITCIETAHAVNRTTTPTTSDTLALLGLVLDHLHPDDDPLPIEPVARRLAANLKIHPR